MTRPEDETPEKIWKIDENWLKTTKAWNRNDMSMIYNSISYFAHHRKN